MINLPNKKYGSGNKSILIDGWAGSYDFNDGNWLGFEGTDFESVIDLGEVKSIKNISASFLENQSSWIFLPQEVKYFISNDDKNFREISSFSQNIKPNLNMEAKEFNKSFINESCRFIKIAAKNIKICPPWHQGKGGKAWIFIDEIYIK